MKYTQWSQEERDFLIANYPQRGGRYCANHLNRTKQTVNQTASNLGLVFVGLLSSSPDNKICRKCMTEKALTDFRLIKNKPDTYCKDCRKALAAKFRNPIKQRQYYLQNAEKLKAGVIARTKERLQSDPLFRMIHNMKTNLRRAIKHNKKSNSTAKLTGCTMDDLRNHIASQFKTGMTWDNYGEWEIDHIRPCSSFDFSKPEEQKACFHFTNLQPLWKADNRRKSDNYQSPTDSQ